MSDAMVHQACLLFFPFCVRAGHVGLSQQHTWCCPRDGFGEITVCWGA